MSGLNELCKCSNKTVCNPKHGQPIDDVDECRQAALSFQFQESFKFKFKDSRFRSMYPRGCYFLRDNGNIYFNTHYQGRKSANSEQICKFEQIKGK